MDLSKLQFSELELDLNWFKLSDVIQEVFDICAF